MARPKLDPGEKKARLTLWLPPAEHAAVDAAAKRLNVSVTDFARLALRVAVGVDAAMPPVERGRGSVTSPGAVSPAPRAPSLVEPSHKHLGGKALPSGILPCSFKGCTARKVGEKWVEGS